MTYDISKLVGMPANRIYPEFQDFLLSRKLVAEKNVPYYARWVSKALTFSNESKPSNHDALILEFIHSLKLRENIED
ncbi:MAG: hypothetical protein ABSB22_14730 [Thermodesulfobacteriota bacterium]